MSKFKIDIHKILISLPLPWDVVRIIKQYMGPVNAPTIVTEDEYENYTIRIRRRHKGRSFTI